MRVSFQSGISADGPYAQKSQQKEEDTRDWMVLVKGKKITSG